jgi:hypothetical protein
MGTGEVFGDLLPILAISVDELQKKFIVLFFPAFLGVVF